MTYITSGLLVWTNEQQPQLVFSLLPIASWLLCTHNLEMSPLLEVRQCIERRVHILILSVISPLIFRQVQLTQWWKSHPTSPPCCTPRQLALLLLTSCSTFASSITGWILMRREICQVEEIWLKAWLISVTVNFSLFLFLIRINIYILYRYPSLASTTVTGIPMKEEQNASSSANYDVELFHHGESHARLLGITPPITMACSTAKT